MPVLSFNSSFDKNGENIITPDELLDLYFYGIPITEPNGSSMPTSTIKHFITSAQKEVEKYLNLKLVRQVIREKRDFDRNEFRSWGYIRTTYPCVTPVSLGGYIGQTRQISYPKEWLSSQKINDGEQYHRQMYLIPSTNSPTSHQAVYTGSTPHLTLGANYNIPNYWEVEYETGFCEIPSDLLNAVGMLASINVFHIMGDLILGAGIASQSIGIDGLSQSISTTSSATNAGYGARITGYIETLNGKSLNDPNGLFKRLYNYYKGFTFNCF